MSLRSLHYFLHMFLSSMRYEPYWSGLSDHAINSVRHFYEILEKAPDWVKNHIQSMETEADRWVVMSNNYKNQYELRPPALLQGNSESWRLILDICRFSLRNPECIMKKGNQSVNQAWQHARMSTLIRSMPGLIKTVAPPDLEEYKEGSTFRKFMAVLTIREELMSARMGSNQKLSSAQRKAQDENLPDKITECFFDITASNNFFEVINMQGFYCVRVIHSNSIYALPGTHLTKVIDFLRGFSNLMFSIPLASYRQGPSDAAEEILDMFRQLSQKNPEAVGEWIKAGRNRLVARLDESRLFPETCESMLISSMDIVKREMSNIVCSSLHRCFHEMQDQVNYSSMYRIVPHPDTPIEVAMDNIQGTRDPNPTDDDAASHIEGILRHGIYMSLRASGFDVRCPSDTSNIRTEASKRLAELINGTNISKAKLSRESILAWENIRFSPVRGIAGLNDIEVPAKDKSSAPSTKYSFELLEMCKDYHTRHMKGSASKNEYKGSSIATAYRIPGMELDPAEGIRPVNDVRTTLQGVSELSAKDARNKLTKLVREHRLFEERYASKGIGIDQIPSEDLERFVRENDNARANVFTEPKLKEKHKEVTRIFYMAEQAVKAITQRVERISRQMSRRQIGVSIVKSYAARRKDLENFCRQVKKTDAVNQPVFVSFDMSSFSMKFPMALVRIYGKIMAEITGDEDLERIDILFRSAQVIHNTRGHFSFFSGVRGGFEGFLNFVWSSIHASIMDAAVRDSEIKGPTLLLTFSDDGLLYFQVPSMEARERVPVIVKKIQEIYGKCGLEFNLNKTLVSSTTWEYLGSVCHDGKLLPFYVKELCSACTYEPTPGFNPTSAPVQTFSSHASSLASAHFPAYMAYALTTHASFIYIKHRFQGITWDLVHLLHIVPYESGGFRIPSPYECGVSSTIETYSEFLADLLLYQRSYNSSSGSIIDTICYGISENLKPASDAVMALCLGKRYRTTMRETAGISAQMFLMNEIEKNGRALRQLSKHPLDNRTLISLASIFKTIGDLNPQAIGLLILSTPAWAKYSADLALMRSKSGHSMAGSSAMKRAQRQDTKNTEQSIAFWMRLHTTKISITSPIESMDKAIHQRYLRDYHLMPVRPSPRVAMGYGQSNIEPDINVWISKADMVAKFFGSASYLEPDERIVHDSSRIAWAAESTLEGQYAGVRKILKVCCSILSNNYRIADQLRMICRVFGVDMPSLERGQVGDISRLESILRARPDIRIGTVALLISRSGIRLSGNLAQWMRDITSGDRTTYLQSARFFAAESWISEGIMRETPSETMEECHFKFKTNNSDHMYGQATPLIKLCLTNTVMISLAPPPEIPRGEEVPSHIAKEFYESVSEMVMLQSTRNTMASYVGKYGGSIEVGDESIEIAYASYIKAWLSRFINTSSETVASSIMFIGAAYLLKQQACVLAIRMMAYEHLSSKEARRAQRALAAYLAGGSEDEPLGKLAEIILQEIDQFVKHISGRISLLPSEIMDENIIIEALGDKDALLSYVLGEYTIRCMCKASPIDKKIILLKQDTGITASPKKIHLAREMLNSTLDTLYAICFKHKWNTEKISSELEWKEVNYWQVDSTIDCIMIAKEVLRPSSHREYVYNSKTFEIEAIKFYCCLYSAMKKFWGPFLAYDERKEESVHRFSGRRQAFTALFRTNRHMSERSLLSTRNLPESMIDEAIGFIKGFRLNSFQDPHTGFRPYDEVKRNLSVRIGSHGDHKLKLDTGILPIAQSRIVTILKHRASLQSYIRMFHDMFVNAGGPVSWVHSLQTGFHESMMQKCYDRIQEYSQSVLHYVDFDIGEEVSLELNKGHETDVKLAEELSFSFTKPISLVTHKMSEEEVSQLIYANTIELMFKSSLWYAKLIGMFPAHITSLFELNKITKDGPNMVTFRMNSEEGPSIFFLRFNTAIECYLAALKIINTGKSVITAWKEEKEGSYYIGGASLDGLGLLGEGRLLGWGNLEEAQDMCEGSPDKLFVPSPMLRAKNLMLFLSQRANREEIPTSMPNEAHIAPPSTTIGYSAMRIQSTTVMRNHPFLVHASSMLISPKSDTQRVVAYLLFLLDFLEISPPKLDKTRIDSREKTAEHTKLHNFIKEATVRILLYIKSLDAKRGEQVSITNEIKQVILWGMINRLSPSIEITKDVRGVQHSIPSITRDVPIGLANAQMVGETIKPDNLIWNNDEYLEDIKGLPFVYKLDYAMDLIHECFPNPGTKPTRHMPPMSQDLYLVINTGENYIDEAEEINEESLFGELDLTMIEDDENRLTY